MKSLWQLETDTIGFPSLENDIETDTVIIGGGLTGILCAYLLSKASVENVVIEADTVGSGTSGSSTGKLTAQHGLIYSKLIKQFGLEKASEYARSNLKAVDELKEIIKDENIDCSLSSCSAYIYTLNDTVALKEEVEASKKLNINQSFSKVTRLPFKVQGAIYMEDQAKLDPYKLTLSLAKNQKVYEHTRAIDVIDNKVKTNGGTIKAKHIVFACRYPFLNIPGYYFLRESQHASYVVALKNAATFNGAYMDAAANGLSFRTVEQNGEIITLLAGFDVRSGKNSTGGRFKSLLAKSRQFWPECELMCSWFAQDCRTIDEVPYIGLYSEQTPNYYVASGFNKWGISLSMVAANKIKDMILYGNKDESIFSPSRFKMLPSMKNLASSAANTISSRIKQEISFPSGEFDSIGRDEAKHIEYEGEKYGVYRDMSGKLHIIHSSCPHLGCRLEWDADTHLWSCPCHGSIFDIDGNIQSGPSVNNVKTFKH